MYEHHTHGLLAWPEFLRRAAGHLFVASLIVLASVVAGTFGYHLLGRLQWVDAFLNASMILSGMGPVDRLVTTSAKLFAALYALFSGLVLVSVIGITVAPWLHRLFHLIHLDDGDAR
jgi:hypothetical protein